LITIHLQKTAHSITEVTVSGHGDGIKGEDIVCSAVSALAQTALSGLLHYGKEDVISRMRKGEMLIRVKENASKEHREAFNIILSTLYLGLENIRRNYPERVSLEVSSAPVE
jgi:uncharacterized protein YsxB (DUF464 family)